MLCTGRILQAAHRAQKARLEGMETALFRSIFPNSIRVRADLLFSWIRRVPTLSFVRSFVRSFAFPFLSPVLSHPLLFVLQRAFKHCREARDTFGFDRRSFVFPPFSSFVTWAAILRLFHFFFFPLSSVLRFVFTYLGFQQVHHVST